MKAPAFLNYANSDLAWAAWNWISWHQVISISLSDLTLVLALSLSAPWCPAVPKTIIITSQRALSSFQPCNYQPPSNELSRPQTLPPSLHVTRVDVSEVLAATGPAERERDCDMTDEMRTDT